MTMSASPASEHRHGATPPGQVRSGRAAREPCLQPPRTGRPAGTLPAQLVDRTRTALNATARNAPRRQTGRPA